MTKANRLGVAALVAFAVGGGACGGGTNTNDGGALDARADTSIGADVVAQGDALEVSSDAGPAADAALDSSIDVSVDVSVDAASDASTEASADGASDSASDGASLLALGAVCAADTECSSATCRTPPGASARVCVQPCHTQADCSAVASSYCQPTSSGATAGLCLPLSAHLCGNCSADTDCAGGVERCIQAPGDTVAACHSDCSLGGDSACPADYHCVDVSDSGSARRLCVPASGGCSDAQGGRCDVGATQSCQRGGPAGTCDGQRSCRDTGRLSACSATVPAYRASCSVGSAPSCATTVDPAVLALPASCGSCSNSCPGIGMANSDATCSSGSCGLSCRGENYDVNGNAADGCERVDADGDHHTTASGRSLGTVGCDNLTNQSFTGTILSDARVHSTPAVTGFVTAVGSAPDYAQVTGSGTGVLCTNDLSATITTTGGGTTSCYRMQVVTGTVTLSATVNGSGSASVTQAAPAYTSGSSITFVVEKICSLPVQEAVSYTVSYHL